MEVHNGKKQLSRNSDIMVSGKKMIEFVEDIAREAHGKSIVVEIVNENVTLKKWYMERLLRNKN